MSCNRYSVGRYVRCGRDKSARSNTVFTLQAIHDVHDIKEVVSNSLLWACIPALSLDLGPRCYEILTLRYCDLLE
jgi:hypothetical protein